MFFILATIMFGCDEEPLPEPNPEKVEAPELTQKINQFIEETMNDVYLWYKEVPEIDTRYEFDSKSYFSKLLYTEDKWSFVTDDVKTLLNSFDGIEKTYGWSLAFGIFSDTKTIFALVEFVYPNTPADQIGVKRGDMIFEMNGTDITETNYRDLLFGESTSITFGQYTNTGITNVKTLNITAKTLALDPVVITNVVEHEGRKIGYLFYAQYIDDFNSSLDDAFQYLLEQNFSDLVLDLRYNPGGTTLAAQHLCSSVAPLDVTNSAKTLVSFQWNDKYQQYWQQRNETNQLEIPFINTTPLKLGLKKLHVITGSGTASASELSITGLKPYMEITTVGDTTFGKYTASITLEPKDFYKTASYYSDFENWGIQPIILRYANSLGVTDFRNGFAPDILAKDNLFDGIPLGDKNETLFKAAIEDITGTQVLAIKKAEIKRSHTIFDRGFSKFDINKREILFNNNEIKILK